MEHIRSTEDFDMSYDEILFTRFVCVGCAILRRAQIKAVTSEFRPKIPAKLDPPYLLS
jgi:hypothetical protein